MVGIGGRVVVVVVVVVVLGNWKVRRERWRTIGAYSSIFDSNSLSDTSLRVGSLGSGSEGISMFACCPSSLVLSLAEVASPSAAACCSSSVVAGSAPATGAAPVTAGAVAPVAGVGWDGRPLPCGCCGGIADMVDWWLKQSLVSMNNSRISRRRCWMVCESPTGRRDAVPGRAATDAWITWLGLSMRRQRSAEMCASGCAGWRFVLTGRFQAGMSTVQLNSMVLYWYGCGDVESWKLEVGGPPGRLLYKEARATRIVDVRWPVQAHLHMCLTQTHR